MSEEYRMGQKECAYTIMGVMKWNLRTVGILEWTFGKLSWCWSHDARMHTLRNSTQHGALSKRTVIVSLETYKLKWQVPQKNKKNNYGIKSQALHLQDGRTERWRLTHREKAGVSQAPLTKVLPSSAYYLGKWPNSHEAHHHADSLHLHCVPARLAGLIWVDHGQW
jgi:hypothetical protein